MERLRQYLEEQDMSQSELAQLMGVKQPTVWEWVHGDSKPSADRLIELSKVTGISIDELLGTQSA